MSALASVLAITGALLAGVISPGPSFVVVARTAVSRSRRDGLTTALGMGAGGVVFAAAALVGLYTLLSSVGWLYAGLKIAGGLWLIWIGVKIWRHASAPLSLGLAPSHPGRSRSAFWSGLATQLSNPKAAIVYGSVFAALLPQHPPLWCYLALPVIVFSIETGWYSAVALGFSTERPRALYLRAKKWVDRISAGVVTALGLRLCLTAQHAGL